MYKHHEDFESIQVRKGIRARFRKLKQKMSERFDDPPLYQLYQKAFYEFLEREEKKNE